MRDFSTWLAGFRSAIAGYKYYTDFDKIYRNVDAIKVELNIMNSLIGSQDIEKEFIELYRRYPEILKCIPILLAKRESDILTVDQDGERVWNFKCANYDIEEYTRYSCAKQGCLSLCSRSTSTKPRRLCYRHRDRFGFQCKKESWRPCNGRLSGKISHQGWTG